MILIESWNMELFDRKHGQAGQEQNALEATNENQYDSKNKQLKIELQVANITRWCIQQCCALCK
jgi:hypothetical protein